MDRVVPIVSVKDLTPASLYKILYFISVSFMFWLFLLAFLLFGTIAIIQGGWINLFVILGVLIGYWVVVPVVLATFMFAGYYVYSGCLGIKPKNYILQANHYSGLPSSFKEELVSICARGNVFMISGLISLLALLIALSGNVSAIAGLVVAVVIVPIAFYATPHVLVLFFSLGSDISAKLLNKKPVGILTYQDIE